MDLETRCIAVALGAMLALLLIAAITTLAQAKPCGRGYTRAAYTCHR